MSDCGLTSQKTSARKPAKSGRVTSIVASARAVERWTSSLATEPTGTPEERRSEPSVRPKALSSTTV